MRLPGLTVAVTAASLAVLPCLAAAELRTATLKGVEEVPAISTEAVGLFAAFVSDDAISWTLSYSDIEGGSVAIAVHGIEMSSARGAPDIRGAVMSVTWPSLRPCGHKMVDVVCLTGSSGTSAHSRAPTIPATTATSRASRCIDRSLSSGGTRHERMRRARVV